MTRLSNTWTTIAVLSCLLLALPVSADNHMRANSVSKKAMLLKPLTPQVDLSNEPDLFDQAVKEYAAGKMPQAEKLFEKVIYLDPTNADAHFNLGAIKEWRNDLPSALSHYRAAMLAKPKDTEISDAIKAVQYKIKNRVSLEAQTARVKKDHEISEHSKMAKDAFSSQNYNDAIVHLSYLADAMPEDPKIQFALGQSLRALKNFNWAAYRLKMAIFLDPDNDLYRKTLVELDREMQDIQGKAFSDSADMVLTQVVPFQFVELADVGFRYAF